MALEKKPGLATYLETPVCIRLREYIKQHRGGPWPPRTPLDPGPPARGDGPGEGTFNGFERKIPTGAAFGGAPGAPREGSFIQII